jgi:hypothetical protein
MNTLVKSFTSGLLTLVSAFTWAQGITESGQEFDGPKFIETLRADELQTTQRGDLVPNTRTHRVMRQLSQGIPPSREGIPGYDEEPSADDLVQQGYPTNILIRRTVEEAMRKPMGRRIMFYETQAQRIIENSGEKANEEATRLVLNRSVDTVQNIIRWAGRNSEMVAQFLAQFYVQNYEIALAYTNSPPPTYVDQAFPRAKVGIFYSRMLFSNHGALISDSAKAIMLIKLIGYLGQDLNSDLRRRNDEYRYALLDIVNIQKSDDQYQSILNSLAAKQEPRSSDVAGLRSQISRILMSLPKN